MIEHRVYGGPGCGKTTYLSRQIRNAVSRHGQAVMVCSFSNAAANELVTRDLPLPPKHVGTLHSFCRQAIGGNREIAETVSVLDEWNEQHGSSGRWHVPKSSFGATGPAPETTIWTRYGSLRNRMVSRENWPTTVRHFADKWEAWKSENELLDFTDLIEVVHIEKIPCPFPIAVLFADEAQDYSALEMSVVRAWGGNAEYFVLAGDDQQALYSFRGASAEVLLTPELPTEQVTILDQSYRLPSVILDYATAYGNTMSRFQPKNIKPIEDGGSVEHLAHRLRDPRLIRVILDEATAGNTVMVLASCSYLLKPVLAGLRKAAAVFHNPYRPTYSPWNPCRGGVERLQVFLKAREAMKWRDVILWFEHLDSRLCGMAKKAKDLVRATAKEDGSDVVTAEDFKMLAGFDLPPPDPRWFFDHLLRSKLAFYTYAREVVRVHGIEGFERDPRIIVGTYHSVKGGEADVVLMSSDVSRVGAEEFAQDADPARRMFYVGMTRAKKKLVILEGERSHISLPHAKPYEGIHVEIVPF